MHTKMLRSFCVGSFKLDVWTVYKQPGKATLRLNEQIAEVRSVIEVAKLRCLHLAVFIKTKETLIIGV